MLVLAHVEDSLEEARSRLQIALDSGEALERLRKNVEAQGGDPRVCDEASEVLPLVNEFFKVESRRSGYITAVETTEVGHAIAALGGGRVRIDDTIDPSVGFMSEARIGDKVRAGQTLGMVYSRDASKAKEAASRIQATYEISDEFEGELPILIKEVVNE
jgi:thymidine phosphorylase